MNTSSSWKKWLLVSVALLVLGGSIARAIIARKAQQTELAQSTESAQAQSIYLAPHDVQLDHAELAGALRRGVGGGGPGHGSRHGRSG